MSRHAINRYVTLGPNVELNLDPDWPDSRNPPFVGIFARQVRLKRGANVLRDEEVAKALSDNQSSIPSPHTSDTSADFVVAGANCFFLPLKSIDERLDYVSPFLVEGTKLKYVETEGLSFALGLASLLCALDWIALSRAPFEKLIAEGFAKRVRHDR